MTDPERLDGSQPGPERSSWTIIILIGGLVLLAFIIIYLATRGNGDEDKLTNRTVSTGKSAAESREKLCASSATYGLIKRELFRRAAQLRGSDQAAFDRLSGVAVVRMENPVMVSEDSSTSAVNCSGSLALDLPPGVQVVGGRRTLSSDVDYTVTMAADGSGPVVLLKNADAIVTPLATLAQVSQPTAQAPQQAIAGNVTAPEGSVAAPQPSQSVPAPGPARTIPQRPQPPSAQASFDCSAARTRGETAVCGDSGLAALDRQMASEYARAFSVASPEQRAMLKDTAHRFYAYRDRCPTNACISDAYTGRIREIRDIIEGRWEQSQ